MKVSYSLLCSKNIADFLILTATEIETKQLLQYLEQISDSGILEVEHEERLYAIGKLGAFNVIHCQCENMGTQEAGSSILTATNALNDWPCIKAVIMVGIAFGMYDEVEARQQQRYGDILVATSIYPYENQKKKPGENIYRGSWHDSNIILQDAFKIVKEGWNYQNINGEDTRVELCKMLSGEKLVDDLAYRNLLKEKFVDARGGEMEGIGVASACINKKIPWILLKAICDFADGNKGSGKKEKQINAANAAVLVCKSALEQSSLLSPLCKGEISSYYHDINKNLLRQIFFNNYDLQYEVFYAERGIDNIIEKYISVRGCWIYGGSGVGKTVALSRAIQRSGLKYIFVDLSTCVKSSIDEMLIKIYEIVCECVGEEINTNLRTLRQIAPEIGRIIDNHYQNEELYLFIEEIPLNPEEKEAFDLFIQSVFALIINNQLQFKRVDVRYVLSSLAPPVIPMHQTKVCSFIKILEMPRWTDEECLCLVNKITEALHFTWNNISISDFVNKMENSPRTIKDTLRTLHLLGISDITNQVLKTI